MIKVYNQGTEAANNAHTIYISEGRATIAFLNGQLASVDFPNAVFQSIFIAGAMEGKAALITGTTILKQCEHQNIQTNPFPVIRNDWMNGHSVWRQVTEDKWDEQLHIVPPLSQDGNRWLQSEPWSHDKEPVYLAGMVRDSQYFFKYQTPSEYHYERLHEEKQVTVLGEGRAIVNGFPGLLWSREFIHLTDAEITDKAKSIELHSVRIWIEGNTIHIFLSDARYLESLTKEVPAILSNL